MIMKKTKKDEKMTDTRDIRISVTELQLIAEQLRDSGREDLDFLYDMLAAIVDGEDGVELYDLTA
jgi:propanediol dehydratase small subunit